MIRKKTFIKDIYKELDKVAKLKRATLQKISLDFFILQCYINDNELGI